MPAPILVFDLDGTLVDTAPDLAQTLNVVLTRHGFEPVHYDQARMMIGGGARFMLDRALQSQDANVRALTLDRMFDAFVEHYAAQYRRRIAAVSGLSDALDRLAR